MKSLEKQLQVGLAILLLIILIGQLIITNYSQHKILSNFVGSHLKQSANRIFENLRLIEANDTQTASAKTDDIKIHWRRLNPVYSIPDSGHYYSVKVHLKNQEKIINSPSLQSNKLPFYTGTQSSFPHNIHGLDGQRLMIWTQVFELNGRKVFISVAEDIAKLSEQRKHFMLVFLALGVLGFLLLIALQRYILRRLFKHLDSSRQEIKEIAQGKRQNLSEQVPSEIYPLVKELNHTLSLMQQRLDRSRNSLGNLAHALKTPLSILMQALDDKSLVNEPKTVQAKLQAERIQELMKRELKRANLAGLGNTSQRFNPHKELPVLANVLKQAHKRDNLRIKISMDEAITDFGDREDMLELFGNLLDNACKWAKNRVLCNITQDDKSHAIVIQIEDDGAGQIKSELKKLTQRGTRLDENIEGYGLGLAICKDIVKLYNGTLEFKSSKSWGGLLVAVTIPNG